MAVGKRSHSGSLSKCDEEEEPPQTRESDASCCFFSPPLHLLHPTERSVSSLSSLSSSSSLPFCHETAAKNIKKSNFERKFTTSRLSVWIMMTIVIPSMRISTSEAISIINDRLRQPIHVIPNPSSPFVINSSSSESDSNALHFVNEARRLRRRRRADHQDSSISSNEHHHNENMRNGENCVEDSNLDDDEMSCSRRNAVDLDSFSRAVTASSVSCTSWNSLFDDGQDYDLEQVTQDAISTRNNKILQNDMPNLTTDAKNSHRDFGLSDVELHLQREAFKVRSMSSSTETVTIPSRLSAPSFLVKNKNTAKICDTEYPETSTPLSVVGGTAVLTEMDNIHLDKVDTVGELIRQVRDRSVVSMKVKNVKREKNAPFSSNASTTSKTMVQKRLKDGKPAKKNIVGAGSSSGSGGGRVAGKANLGATGQKGQKSNNSDVTKSAHVDKQNDMFDAVSARVSHDEEIELSRIIQRGVELHNLKSKFEEEHGRDITRQEWAELAKLESPKQLRRMVSDYRKAKNKLVVANMGLVHSVVRSKMGMTTGSGKDRVNRSGVSYDELVQEGSLGLLRAAELFDPSRGLRFSTYATIWIKGMLSNSNVSETIKVPLREKTKWNKIQTAISELQMEFGADDNTYRPTEKAIAERTGMDVEAVTEVIEKMKSTKNMLSIDFQYETQSRSGGDTHSFQALQHDKNLMDDVDLVERLHVRADVIAAIVKNLDRREARLMDLRYGLNDGRTRSIKECAEEMGISESRAQQLAAGCLKKLREADDAESLHEYLLSIA